jgi:hypothetical protein
MSHFRFFVSLLMLLALLSGSQGAVAQEDGTDKEEDPGYAVEGATPGRPGEIQFLSGPQSGNPLDIALKYLQQNKHLLGLTGVDLADLAVTDMYTSTHNNVTHIYLRQQFKGIEVANGNLNINIAGDGSVINLGHSFVSNLAAAVNRQAPARNASQSVTSAARQLGLSLGQELRILNQKGGPTQEVLFSDGGISQQPIPAKLVYQPVGPDRVRLAWQIEIYELSGDHWWNTVVDAETGEVLAQHDYVDHDNWGAPSTGVAATVISQKSASPLYAPGADEYNVFALPKEHPNDGSRTLEANPANATASPFGWHDTDGAAGPEFTLTRGNNVHAYTDIDANNVPDLGSDPDGGPNLVFDFPLDLSQGPSTYRPAAVTNLFYWNNIIHDVFYGYGFDEPAGNFQVNNYGNSGLGNDDVRAEAQDGSGLNNANFGTPVDGMRPRMQMFIWIPPGGYSVSINAGPIAGDYTATPAVFGPQLSETPPVTGEVTLVNDGTGASTDACEALVGFPAGNIALLDRGTCNFTVKVKNAQNAGAIGAIVANNVAGNPITMGGADPTIVIPSVMVSLDNGNLFKASLPFNATLQFTGDPVPSRDSDLDSGVIVHEYGHGISNRLTGGPSNVSCLGNAEQMGEGWSDWLALTLTTHPSDTATTVRGIGTYVIFEPPDGGGIRPTPYTTDLAVNPTTYGDIGGLAIPHGVGYAWSSMLWEVYWNLVNKYGYNADVYADWTTGGNNLAIQLVIDGMKLQPCRPGFVDGRDAILLADRVLTGGVNQCSIWEGFAKRGLGFSANQGSNTSTTDGTEAFDLPFGCHFNGFIGNIHNPPALNQVNAGSTIPVIFSLDGDRGLDIFAAGYPASQQIDCDTKAPIGSEQPTNTPPDSSLTYNPETDRYNYPWKTSKGWMNTCRQLIVRFSDNTDPRIAYFSFSK